ncbi:MAG: S41 family peptidase [Candidatus Falkowbacteria bacterium]
MFKNMFQGEKRKKYKKILRVVLIVIVVLLVLFVTFVSGAYSAQRSNIVNILSSKEVSADTQGFDYNLYQTVLSSLKQSYVDKGKISDKDAFYGALKGMTASIGDPYTVFFDPKNNSDFKNDMAGTFEGIGAEIALKNDVITIVSPLDGMPAQKAGLRAGDQIYAVNGTSTLGLSVDAVVRMIRGPKDTSVTVSVYRSGLDKPKDYVINRGVITVKSVKTSLRSDGLYVVTVSAFNNDTRGLFDKAVGDILQKNPKGIILDLRNNPGGYLDTAVAMASEWVEAGPVVIEKSGDGKENKYLSNGNARLKNFKTVILVNQGSASASEIVSGALRDYNKATLIGQKTFGKGSVQTLVDFADGSAVKVTIAKWFTPNGDSINEIGIEPNKKVEMTNDDYNKGRDPQMDEAVKSLLSK